MNLLDLLTLVTLLGCGVVAGVFYGFSTFVMKALGALPPAQGIAAMQSINVVVINPVFMAAFVGTAGTSLALAVAAFVRWPDRRATWWLAGALLYVVGTFVVTMAFNVPLNDGLAAVQPGSSEGTRVWASYLVTWTRWNHVRTLASLAAAAAFAVAFRVRG